MATRSRTALFCKYRDSLKTHRKTPLRGASGMLVEGRQTKNLLSALSDDESSAIDARAYSVPPAWVTLVDDLNRDISSIKIKVADLNELSGKHLLPGFGERTSARSRSRRRCRRSPCSSRSASSGSSG